MNRAQFFDNTLQGLEALIARTEQFRNLPSGVLNQKTAAHDWTLGELFNHLVKSDVEVAKRFYAQRPVTPKAQEDDIRHTSIGRFILSGMTRPNIPVPKAFVPDAKNYDSSVVQEYLDNLILHRNELAESKKFDLAKLILKSPVIPLLRYNGYDLLAICVAHGERHLAQAEAVLRMLEPIGQTNS